MAGSELMTDIILASTTLFALSGVFLGRMDKKNLNVSTKKRLRHWLLGEFWCGVVAVMCAVIWFLCVILSGPDIATRIIWIIAAFIFVAQLFASYRLLFLIIRYGSDND